MSAADVAAAYRWIFGREPESETAVANHLHHEDQAALREALLSSTEFASLSKRGGFGGTGQVSLRTLSELYWAMLGRGIENPRIARQHQRAGRTAIDVFKAVLASDEYRERMRQTIHLADLDARTFFRTPVGGNAGRPRILLFGAFGNGNLGDAAQPASIARLLAREVGAECRVISTSWLHSDSFQRGTAGVRPFDTIVNPAQWRGYDFMLFGGGGLFGSPHFPLHHEAWIDALRRFGIPYGFLGIGAGVGGAAQPDQAEPLRRLFSDAAFVTVRDAESRTALEVYRTDVAMLPDPVLTEWLLAPASDEAPASDRDGALLILKRPVSRAESDFLDACESGGTRNYRVAIMEPAQDQQLGNRFGELEAITDFPGLVAACRKVRRVVSMRYHGCIAGIMAGADTYGGPAPKIHDLMAQLGRPEHALMADQLPCPAAADGEAGSWPELATLTMQARETMQAIAGTMRASAQRRG